MFLQQMADGKMPVVRDFRIFFLPSFSAYSESRIAGCLSALVSFRAEGNLAYLRYMRWLT